jgi:hypothetical protein
MSTYLTLGRHCRCPQTLATNNSLIELVIKYRHRTCAHFPAHVKYFAARDSGAEPNRPRRGTASSRQSASSGPLGGSGGESWSVSRHEHRRVRRGRARIFLRGTALPSPSGMLRLAAACCFLWAGDAVRMLSTPGVKLGPAGPGCDAGDCLQADLGGCAR